MKLREEILDFWVENDLNVLFTGPHGVGKSTIVIDTFERAGLKYAYFSASTMDPWVDFIGVPKEKNDEKGSYLELVRPLHFRDDEIEAIFIDEYNRSHKKIRNAVMELIQFKSINGKKFKNLKIVWAAVNPEEDGVYDVQKLDPAQKDRFHIWCDIPAEPSKEWFTNRFGRKLGSAAVEWWKDLPDDLKTIITPRRLEYALQVHQLKGGNIRWCLPLNAPIKKLIESLNYGPASDAILDLYHRKDQEGAKKWFAIENNYAEGSKYITAPEQFKISIKDWLEFFLPAMPSEKLSLLFASDEIIKEYILENAEKFSDLINNVLMAGTNKSLIRAIKRKLGSGTSVLSILNNSRSLNPETALHGTDPSEEWDSVLANLKNWPTNNAHERSKVVREIEIGLPSELNYNQAVATLELLNKTEARRWEEKLKEDEKGVSKILGWTNHCLQQMHKNNIFQSWEDAIKESGERFALLVQKLRVIEAQERIWTP